MDNIDVPGRAIVRNDTNTVVGVVGGNYKVLTHAEALDPILERLTAKGVTTFKRVALTANGAKMFANIYFPSEEMSVGRGSNGDNCWPGISIVNSLDGTLKYSMEATIYRLVCTNGMRMPVTLASLFTTHSKNKSFDDIVEEILAQVSDTNRFAVFQKWANTLMTESEMREEVTKVIHTSMFPARYMELVDNEIARETSNGVRSVWGLYNAFNSVLEHNLVREKGKVERARMLDENLFKTFERTFK
jgi:hypothetical protein